MKIFNKKRLIITTTVAATIILTIVGVFSLFSANETNSINLRTGSVDCLLTSKINKDADENLSGLITITNKSTIPIYMRLKVQPTITIINEDSQTKKTNSRYNDEYITCSLNENTSTNWELADDGYYYYKSIVQPASLIQTFEINNILVEDKEGAFLGMPVNCNLYSEVEIIQATEASYKENWKLTDLPVSIVTSES